ncbi:MAG TPA: FtsX-like permease family protein [Pirellulales bacterium]
MKTPLLLRNLLHDWTRTLVGIGGVAFAVVLMLVQLGFLNSVALTATLLYRRLDFDILLTSRQYQTVAKAGFFSRQRLYEAASTPGVRDARPLYLDFALWLTLDESVPREERRRRGVLAIAFPLEQQPLTLRDLNERRERLKRAGVVFMDELSKDKFGDWRHHPAAEINGRHMDIGGTFHLGTGFGPDGNVIMGDQTFRLLFPHRSLREVSLGLVRVAPGRDARQVCQELERRLPKDVLAQTRTEIQWREQKYWILGMSIGIIFSFGVVVGFLVGAAIVYQVLSSDIARHIAEYATLRAIGYSAGYLKRLVFKQALILATCGFMLGWLISAVLYRLTEKLHQIPMRMGVLDVPAALPLTVLILTFAMCAGSGLLALRKINRADPAALF